MNAICERPAKRMQTKAQTVLRVAEGDRYVGDILLDEQGRVWRRADTIPADVVMKTYLQHVRLEETCGKVSSRDGRVYLWHVVGGLAGAAATARMQPRLGRASYLGERAVGIEDAGAVAVCVWLRALASVVR